MPPTPTSHWIGFHLFLVLLLAAEYLYARSQGPRKTHGTAIVSTILWVTAALVFSLFILRALGGEAATQYLAGYAIEQALSIDNLFVFLLLFSAFDIKPEHQPKALFWGVLGAIVMRGAFIAAGLELLARFEWISYVFAAVLFYAAVRLVLPSRKQQEDEQPGWLKWLRRVHPVSMRQDRFFVRENNRGMVSVLFLALIAIEITDLVFALDSIPAVLSITRHPFLAYTSNIMAVMNLRALFFLLTHMLSKLRFLHYGLAGVLAFAAAKMLAAHWISVGPMASLAVIVAILGSTIILSLVVRPRASSI